MAKSHIAHRTSQIPHSRPTLDEADVRAVADVVRSGYLAQGEEVRRFEEEMARFVGVCGGVAVHSGTAALHLVLLSMGVGEPDEVILPSYVCTALLNAVRYVGARPVLADVHPETHNLDVRSVKGRITCRTKALLVPHMFGLPADLTELLDLGVPVVEDCAHAIGASYLGRPVGGFGIASIASFYATKMMATGEGGMVLSGSAELLDRARALREYDNVDDYRIRYNYKMTDMQAALGRSQLRNLPGFVDDRRRIARAFSGALDGSSVLLPPDPEDRRHVFYRYVVRCPKNVQAMLDALAQEGVRAARPVYRPLHRYLNCEGFPGAEQAWEEAASIPIYPSLTEEERGRIVRSLRRVKSEAGG